MTNKPTVITIVGPTASGKTDLARFLATELNGEVISADSRQIYRRLDIGTGKEDISPIKQHLIDIVDPEERYTVADWQRDALAAVDDIVSRGKLPIICGGTGLYVSALTEGFDFSENTARSETNPRHSAGSTKKNPPDWNLIEIGVDLPREELMKRINKRVETRIDSGMIQEAKDLMDSGVSAEWLRSIGLEYKYMVDLLEGKLIITEFTEQLKADIRRYAKRQITWFRHHGNVQWIKPAGFKKIPEMVRSGHAPHSRKS